MKGLYPVIVYVLLFAVGITLFVSIYHFTNDFISKKNLELEEAQTEKICTFLKNLKGKEGEFNLDIRNFKIKTNSLKIIGFSSHNCKININTSGSCSEKCKIRVFGDKLIFSQFSRDY